MNIGQIFLFKDMKMFFNNLSKISKSLLKNIFKIFFTAIIIFAFSGCSKGNLNVGGNMENIEENLLLRIQDLPFVKESQIDIEKSLILGEGKSWSGQIFLIVPNQKPAVFNFYVNNLGNFGWKEQTSIRGETSILNYLGENNRVAVISIKEARFNNSEVLISVSPYAEEFEEKVSEFINDKYLEITDWQKDKDN